MRNFTLDYVGRVPVRGIHATLPHPFPGRFPTRLAMQMRQFDGTRLEYLGKPSRIHLQNFISQRHTSSDWWMCEFDRKSNLHFSSYRDGNHINYTLCSLYHPFLPQTAGLDHLLYQLWVLPIDGFRVYSPLPQLSDSNRTSWRNYAMFSGFRPQVEAPKPPKPKVKLSSVLKAPKVKVPLYRWENR